MTSGKTDAESEEVGRWDPGLTQHAINLLRPMVKLYYRSEMRGLENIPAEGCLVVNNHSGGIVNQDLPVFAVDFYDKFGYDRPRGGGDRFPWR